MSADMTILYSCIGAIICIIVFISYFKLPPFLAIFIGSIGAGLIVNMPPEIIEKSFSEGAGKVLGESGYIIALGAMLGSIMSRTGAADAIAEYLLARTSTRLIPWMMAAVAMIIGLPLFFEVGLVLMIPLIATISKRSGLPLLLVAIPALAGMTSLHALIPPHPGPIIAIKSLHADMGLTLIIGIMIAIPAVVLAGPLYAKWLVKKPSLANITNIVSLPESEEVPNKPSLSISIILILLPAILMLGRSLTMYVFESASTISKIIDFIGEPIIALTITVILATVILGWRSGLPHKKIGEILSKSIGPVAVLLLTIGAGGGLKGVLVKAGISDTISNFAHTSAFPIILLAWLIAVAVRQATGSATVATTTTAGILAASFTQLPPLESSLIALAIGSGSVFFCHINDAAYWMIKEFFGLTLKQTLWVWSVLQTIVSITGLALTSLIWFFVV
ncbi:MAG: gluconate:H+ symporter [Acinetobacter sp.]